VGKSKKSTTVIIVLIIAVVVVLVCGMCSCITLARLANQSEGTRMLNSISIEQVPNSIEAPDLSLD